MRLIITLGLLGTTFATGEMLATKEQAIKVVLPGADSVREETKVLTPEQRERLRSQSHLRFPEKQYQLFIAEKAGRVTGYGIVMNEIGKHEFITFMVGIQPNGEIGEAIVMEYRESRGGEVKEKRFLRQFKGKKQSDPIHVNRDIENYTGATLSSEAIARGVKKALLLISVFYPQVGN